MEFEYVCYPKPYVNHRVLSRTEWLMCALFSLAYPSESKLAHPWYQKECTPVHFWVVSLVAGGFYRLEFDDKFDFWRPSRCRDAGSVRQRRLVDACAPLWAKTWRLLERMDSIGELPLPSFILDSATFYLYPQQSIVPMCLMTLVLEGELLTPWLDYLSPDGSSGFKALLKQQQSDNMALRDFKNPYETPYTHLFIKNAIATAEKFDPFRKEFYKPMVKQRQSVTALMAKESFIAFDIDGKPSRQGRSKRAK
jgi:hypothetical protein